MADAYRLAALLKLRERAREEAEQDLAKAQTAQSKAQRNLDAAERFEQECQTKVDDAKAKLYDGAELTIGKIQGREAFTKRLQAGLEEAHEEVERCQEQLRSAQEQVRHANEALIKTKQDEEALLKHREKWELEQKTIRRRREEDEADDIAQTMWLRKK
jgi:flagellar biosynthesis chaperone FliJ